jgi:hypothetical protein
MRRIVSATLAVVVASCGVDLLGTGAPMDAADSGSESDSGSDSGSDSDSGPGSDSGSVSDAGKDSADTGLPPPTIVYGHTATNLYALNPVSKTLTPVGNLTGCASLDDIAVDRGGHILGIGSSNLYSISSTTGACTTIAVNTMPFTLSFVPAGQIPATTGEVLVAYSGSDYVRIDAATGQITTITPAAIAPYAPTGDLVSVEGGGTYVSVNGSGCGDCLLEVNASDGRIKQNWGSIGQSGIYGLAFWSGKVYGFAGGGSIFEITFNASGVTASALPGSPPGAWLGAGSTTIAPLN